MSSDSPKLSRWETLGDRSIAATRIFDVRLARLRHPVRLREREFVVVDAPDWVNVVALTPDLRLVMVNQFRFGSNDFSWAVPGGIIEAGEDATVAGARELAEETGYTGTAARLLGSVHPNPAFMRNRCHLVLVTGATATSALAWDPDEEMEVQAVPVEDVYRWAWEGRITHSLVLNALLLFAPHWEKIRTGAPDASD
ncbi:MAG: NUDIX hydrolase [Opitutaceae bacterium]|nr:NUDIX hydrolase [Opitutaceae bacterium]